MSFARRDLLALLLVLGGVVASLVVWDYGKVDIGMTIETDVEGMHDSPGGLIVSSATPDGNAARLGFAEGYPLLDLTTVDGADVARGAPIGYEIDVTPIAPGETLWGLLTGVVVERTSLDAEHRPPAEPVGSARIATATAGYFIREDPTASVIASLDRGSLEQLLRESIWLIGAGLGIGIAVWWLTARGIAGVAGRGSAVILGAASAAPFVMFPLLRVGAPAGIIAAYVLPISVALVLGLSLARTASEQHRNAARAAAVMAAALAVVLVVRHVTSPPSGEERGVILAVMAAIGALPAIISSIGSGRTLGEGIGVASLGLVPAAALPLMWPRLADPLLPIAVLTALFGLRLLPFGILAPIRASLGRVRATRPFVGRTDPVITLWRDRLCYALVGVALLIGLVGVNTLFVVAGLGLGVGVGLAVRGGFIGEDWMDAAAPLAAAVGVPTILFPYMWLESGDPTNTVPTALAALGVAHVLATRHSDPVWRGRLFALSTAVVILIAALSFEHVQLDVYLIGIVALIPALPTAFAVGPDDPPTISLRLEALAVALTPGAAATVLFPPTNGVFLGLWLVAIVVWRRFTLTPLLGLAQRTQLQRDVAVAAAETERARLAADLHDDALQQLTMLVRTLDDAGQTEAAQEAREVATKLRSVVGDLRLPILDDLGAGAALEWLVERVEPLAGGTVKLERTDATRPPANVELAVFRVAQEALNNAIKHGNPPIAVRYDVNADGRVTLAIDDSGAGIEQTATDEAPTQGHFGLLNMQQRAEQIGALLDVRRWPAGGTRVALEWRPQ